MSWIKKISYQKATGRLKKLYDRIKGPDNYIDNVLSVHSLRPHTLEGHMMLYKAVLHHIDNTLPKWYLEAMGVYVSHLNHCAYCVEHHTAGLKRLLNDDKRFMEVLKCIEENKFEFAFEKKYLAGFHYAEKLTLKINTLTILDFEALKSNGMNDGEILELNQLVSYFNYVNRTVLGLGVDTKGDIIGLSPNDSTDPDNWSHH